MDFNIATAKKQSKGKNNKKLLILAMFFLLLSIALIIIYIFMNTNKKEPEAIPSPEVIEKEKLKILDENSNERPVAIMIDNNIGEGLHAGLQDSYLNYEIIVEGGLTRIMAIYKDRNISTIGPVRSSRHYFLDYALENDAIYAHYGWSPYAENDIKALNVNNINGLTNEKPYWRDTSAIAPHNVFTSTEKIRSFAQEKNYSNKSSNWKLLDYSPREIKLENLGYSEGLIPANQVYLTYSNYQNRSYNYDPANKYYLRIMNGKPHIDKLSNQQLNYKNIIIMRVNNKILDKEGRQDLDTVGSGDGYYITNGYALPIKWSKESRASKTKYTYINGTEITVNDGNTFIQIVPLQNEINIR